MVNTSLFSDIEPDIGCIIKEKGDLSGWKGANFSNTKQSLMKYLSISNMSEINISVLGHSINIRDVDCPGQDNVISHQYTNENQRSFNNSKNLSCAYMNIVEIESNPNLTIT
jgi:hypothetical protein